MVWQADGVKKAKSRTNWLTGMMGLFCLLLFCWIHYFVIYERRDIMTQRESRLYKIIFLLLIIIIILLYK